MSIKTKTSRLRSDFLESRLSDESIETSAGKVNGWSNYETWNVVLWIGNDEDLYNLAMKAGTYKKFLKCVGSMGTTGDGVNWRDNNIDLNEVGEFFNELT